MHLSARLPRILLPLAAALLLTACTQPAPPDAAAPAPASTVSTPPPAADVPAPSQPAAAPPASCDASKAQWAIGQTLDEALLERARVDAGARAVRSLKPGQMVTMEFNVERLNVDVDDAGVVTGVRCG